MQYNKNTNEYYISKENFEFSWDFDTKEVNDIILRGESDPSYDWYAVKVVLNHVQPEKIIFSRVYLNTQYNYNI